MKTEIIYTLANLIKKTRSNPNLVSSSIFKISSTLITTLNIIVSVIIIWNIYTIYYYDRNKATNYYVYSI